MASRTPPPAGCRKAEIVRRVWAPQNHRWARRRVASVGDRSLPQAETRCIEVRRVTITATGSGAFRTGRWTFPTLSTPFIHLVADERGFVVSTARDAVPGSHMDRWFAFASPWHDMDEVVFGSLAILFKDARGRGCQFMTYNREAKAQLRELAESAGCRTRSGSAYWGITRLSLPHK